MAGSLGKMFDHGVYCPFPDATPSLTFAQDAMLLYPCKCSIAFPYSLLADAGLDRGYPRCLHFESWAVMVDLCFASCHLENFYLTTWEEYYTGL